MGIKQVLNYDLPSKHRILKFFKLEIFFKEPSSGHILCQPICTFRGHEDVFLTRNLHPELNAWNENRSQKHLATLTIVNADSKELK